MRDQPSVSGTQQTSSSAVSTGRTSGDGGESLPKRPEELKVDGIDPCKLLTESQQKELGTDQAPRLNADGADSLGNPLCGYRKVEGTPRYGYSVSLVPQEGADVWLKEKRNAEVKVLNVGGFGAVETRLPGDQDISCNVVVDVAEGQSLDMQFTLYTAGAIPLEQMCANARHGAELAVQTLQTLK
ncbi:Protein of unknown function (DUF3558) [Goodfellowiella coeruleoviolacea]|uniref:DUF3558 domain-containing protein n=2 Tax=Goodfellowiella coeruleoviolacea TaxID=334858 RepID=A0AAE3GJ35_9PSEU|nr:Protein of unknown function (DUF3558) [Goodfellowiella coeruleoviolacea]